MTLKIKSLNLSGTRSSQLQHGHFQGDYLEIPAELWIVLPLYFLISSPGVCNFDEFENVGYSANNNTLSPVLWTNVLFSESLTDIIDQLSS